MMAGVQDGLTPESGSEAGSLDLVTAKSRKRRNRIMASDRENWYWLDMKAWL